MTHPHDADPVRASLAEIAALLAPAHPGVAEEVLRAHDSPHAYVSAFADRLDDRGIDEPFGGLAWIALVDALAAHGLLAEFDWKEDPQEIRAQLRKLESRPSVDPWDLFEADAATTLPTDEFLHACGRHYREIGAALAVLDIDSDCYPVAGLRAARADELTALAARAGFPVHHLGTDPRRP
ncbi:DUF6630 family protein [Streptomyces globisporus]|uniref:DUF6630 family protein n=1 Tax=Streptomyces albovinaceus subgroup TaxID=1482558 RepID=UPI0004C4BEA0|nr:MULTISPECIES: DUF6630 family protein [Streptomyces albovinaceus subgroup]PPA44062.1 hypothetical protein BF14_033120 [Streptomyces griseus]RAN21283.1 hypothetical protein A3838_32405 [Streptomyces badius]AWL90138.1 hypothetical protein DIJ69_33230 [Streptomyces globisporus]RAN29224.1 hypothetical protein A3800_32430 [Streptomyces badius]WSF80989.1 hypothetical protein OG838_34965 [Streptomyces globisporus]